jgi:hypothetical protein
LGFVASDDSVQTKSQYADDKDDPEYTHVLIPLPGHAITNGSVEVVEDFLHGQPEEDEETFFFLQLFFFVHKSWAKT